ncbi:MAG: transglutaminase-like domain-containing protein, partial [Thermoplasmata archaeon]
KRDTQRLKTQQPQQAQSKPKKIPSPGKKKKSHWKKGVGILIVAFVLILLLFSPLVNMLPDLWGGPVYPEKAEFTISREITLTTNREINYQIDIPVPIDIPGNNIQRVNSIDWFGSPNTITKYDQEWKIWSGELSSSRTMNVNYHVTTETVKWDYTSDDSGLIEDIPQGLKDTYNRDQWIVDEDGDGTPDDRDHDGRDDVMIEPSSSTIINLAQDITGDKTNLYSKARAIYDWINDNIEYERGSSGLPQHALWTLREGKGDCDEQSFLFCSLARAVDIPAWVELGVLYDRVIDEWGGHGWVRMEFIKSDGTSGWVNIDTVNNQFFARDATRFTSWVDDGGEGHLEDYYLFLSYNYSVLPHQPSPQVSISDEYTNVQMDTEGEEYLGDDGEDIPGLNTAVIVSTIFISTILFAYKKRKR